MTVLQELKLRYPIYPEIKIETQLGEDECQHLELNSLIRKKFKNKWCVIHIRMYYKVDVKYFDKDLPNVILMFNTQAYQTLVLYKFPNLPLNPGFYEDDDQTNETNRLIKLINP